jgi:hypothetical protein
VSDPKEHRTRNTILNGVVVTGFLLLLFGAMVGYARWAKIDMNKDVWSGPSPDCHTTGNLFPYVPGDYQVVADTKGYFWVCVGLLKKRKVTCFPMDRVTDPQECRDQLR